uniref:DNA2/NAM7 helicase-like C-terminal domain-containing protein n=1 Tax=Romanomermis culicivorax TaxID=13658 RepID=A0A915KH85_ROMCU
ITTVDKYQGQQNDFIILSLVRTAAVGHLRDVRRLIVALSRARLGLYILGRLSLFKNCFELTPAFNILCKRPTKLIIFPKESYPTKRLLNSPDLPEEKVEIEDVSQMAHLVYEAASKRK